MPKPQRVEPVIYSLTHSLSWYSTVFKPERDLQLYIAAEELGLEILKHQSRNLRQVIHRLRPGVLTSNVHGSNKITGLHVGDHAVHAQAQRRFAGTCSPHE